MRDFFKVAVVASVVVTAQAHAGPTAELKAQWDAANQDATTRARVLSEGQIAAQFCTTCHGEDGNSARTYAPKLAGQNPLYLLDQLERFAAGTRTHYVMGPLAKNLRHEDRVRIVMYFTSYALKKAGGDKALADKGKPLFQENCARCHGADGRGTTEFPRIAGQNPEYVITTVRYFRDKAAFRQSDHMTQATYKLTDPQIEQIANYIASMD